MTDIDVFRRTRIAVMKGGVVAVAIGLPLLGIGVFLMGDRSGRITATAYVLGLLLLSLGIVRLIWTGWQGSGLSWLIASPAAGILTWTLYELVRQRVPLYGIGIFGEMTAPILSTAVGIGTVMIGWLRGHTSRDIQRR